MQLLYMYHYTLNLGCKLTTMHSKMQRLWSETHNIILSTLKIHIN